VKHGKWEGAVMVAGRCMVNFGSKSRYFEKYFQYRLNFIHSFRLFLQRLFKREYIRFIEITCCLQIATRLTKIENVEQVRYYWEALPTTALIAYCVGVNTPKGYRQPWVKDLPKVPSWRLGTGCNAT